MHCCPSAAPRSSHPRTWPPYSSLIQTLLWQRIASPSITNIPLLYNYKNKFVVIYSILIHFNSSSTIPLPQISRLTSSALHSSLHSLPIRHPSALTDSTALRCHTFFHSLTPNLHYPAGSSFWRTSLKIPSPPVFLLKASCRIVSVKSCAKSSCTVKRVDLTVFIPSVQNALRHYLWIPLTSVHHLSSSCIWSPLVFDS